MILSALFADVRRDLKHTDSGDDRVTDARLLLEVEVGHREVAKLTGCYRRTGELTSVGDQRLYTMPADMFEVVQAYWDDFDGPLRIASQTSLQLRSASWRNATSDTPQFWYPYGTDRIGLYPPPDTADTTIFIEGKIIPWSVGSGISGVVRATNVSTVTTNTAHGLATGDTVRIGGVTDSTFDVASVAVASAATATTFTYANTGTNGSSSGGSVGLITRSATGETGFVLPLAKTTDEPAFDPTWHEILRHYLVWAVAMKFLRDEPGAAERGAEAFELYKSMLDGMKERYGR